MKFFYFPLFILLIFSSCKKVKVAPVSNNDMIIGTWTLSNVSGSIDSVSTLNGTTNSYYLNTTYDSVKSQLIQTVNGNQKVSFPYKMKMKLGLANGADSISEVFTQTNGANVPINYAFSYGSYWNFTSVGLDILGLEKTHIFGNKVSAMAANGPIGSIQAQLSDPSYGITGTYNLTYTRLIFYFQLSYSGNPDVINHGVVTNPSVHIIINYQLTFNKS